jgi:hypothetical protein
MSEYTEQAEKFLIDTGTTFTARLLYSGPYFDEDKDHRDVYEVTLTRAMTIGAKAYTFKFGQSVAHSKSGVEAAIKTLDKQGYSLAGHEASKARKQLQPPTVYDVLASITKYDPGSFKDFCSDFGYNEDSRKAEKTYIAVVEEWKNVERMFGDVLERLQEIQ